MKQLLLILPLLWPSAILGFAANDKWDYISHGESYWKVHYPKCRGQMQSPIDINTRKIRSAKKEDIKAVAPLSIKNYKPQASPVHVENNGHSIQFDYLRKYGIRHKDEIYFLKQFHFHHDSETTIDGKHTPLEAHFVNESPSGHLLVIAVLLEEGSSENILKPYFQHADARPEGADEKSFNPAKIIPSEKDFYYFEGSLTTPPCSEGVHWAVMKHTAKISSEDIEYFSKVDYAANFRSTQPLNGRKPIYFKN